MQLCSRILVLALSILFLQNTYAFESEEIPGQFLVKVKSPIVSKKMLSFLSQGGGVASPVSKNSKLLLVQRPVIEDKSYSIKKLSEIDNIEYVEPDKLIHINALPNDPSLSELWGLVNLQKDGTRGVDIKAREAWDITTGSKNVVVAVIDTGVDYNHKDLKENMWMNKLEANGIEGVDDDGNGFIDDVYGYNFSEQNNDPMDDYGHGTHCAGTIGAMGNDGQGITGVSWATSIMSLKFIDSGGTGTLSAAIGSIDYAIDNGANVMSNSWGGYMNSPALEEAVARANSAGILFIAAAGNESRNNDDASNALYPASYKLDNVVSVAAITKYGSMAYFSNKGKKSVHLGAPGRDIYSTIPNDKYAFFSGTSMATPHVAGVAALVLSEHPNMSHLELKNKILSSVTPLSTLDGVTITGGLLNAYDALK